MACVRHGDLKKKPALTKVMPALPDALIQKNPSARGDQRINLQIRIW